jgi:hypothetical protein
MIKNLTKPIWVATMVLGALVNSGCGKSDAPPMEKIEVQYRQLVAGRYFGRHSELTNLKITNIRCKNQDIATLCTIDATGDLAIRNSLNGTVDVKKLDDKNIDLKFFNRDAFRK